MFSAFKIINCGNNQFNTCTKLYQRPVIEHGSQPEHQQTDPYTLEHVNWISSIRNNTPFVQAEETALSNMCGIMGRESAYTGKTITWEQMTASPLSYAPAKLELGPMDMSAYTVPVPGTGK